MKYKNISTVLDIGTTKVVALIGTENDYGKVKVLGMGHVASEGVDCGEVINVGKATEAIKNALAQAKAQAEVDVVSDVRIGIAGSLIRCGEYETYIDRENSDQLITESDVQRLHQCVWNMEIDPGEKIIDIRAQKYAVDDIYDINNPVGMLGKRLSANFVTAIGKTSRIKNIERCVSDTGVGLGASILQPLASATAVLSEEEKEAGVVLVDIGGGTTDVAIFKDNILCVTAIIPHAGNRITENIKLTTGVLKKQAEKLKVNFGCAWPDSVSEGTVKIRGINGRGERFISLMELSKIIKESMTLIFNDVNTVIDSYGHNSGDYNKRLNAGIVLTGGGSQLKHIKQLAMQLTGMDVRIGLANEHLASEHTSGGTFQEIENPSFATSVGLLIEDLQDKKKNTPQKPELVEELPDLSAQEQPPTNTEYPPQESTEKQGFFKNISERLNNIIRAIE